MRASDARATPCRYSTVVRSGSFDCHRADSLELVCVKVHESFLTSQGKSEARLNGKEDSVLRETLELRRDAVLLDLGKAVFFTGAHSQHKSNLTLSPLKLQWQWLMH